MLQKPPTNNKPCNRQVILTYQFEVVILTATVSTMYSELDDTIQHNNNGSDHRHQQFQWTFTKHTMNNVIQHKH